MEGGREEGGGTTSTALESEKGEYREVAKNLCLQVLVAVYKFLKLFTCEYHL